MSDSDFTQSRLTTDDHRLIARLHSGDREAITLLEKRYGDELRLFCRRMLSDAAAAEDVVQDVFATCCRADQSALPNFSIRGWLYQIARRRCIDLKRRKHDGPREDARGVVRAGPAYDLAIDPITTPAGKALKRDRAVRILSVLDELDDDLRSVVVMRYFQDLPREEIAEAIGLTLAGTKARLSKAMDVLRERLERFGDSSAR